VPIRLLLRPDYNCANTPTVFWPYDRAVTPAIHDFRLHRTATNQSIARALRLTCYHKTTDRRALCLTTIVIVASTVLLPEQTSAATLAVDPIWQLLLCLQYHYRLLLLCLQLNLNSTTTAPACSTTTDLCCSCLQHSNWPSLLCLQHLIDYCCPTCSNNYNCIQGRQVLENDAWGQAFSKGGVMWRRWSASPSQGFA